MLLFCGKRSHEGIKVTSGTRYILTGFIDYFAPDHEWHRIAKDNTQVVHNAGRVWTSMVQTTIPIRPYLLANIDQMRRHDWNHANISSVKAALERIPNHEELSSSKLASMLFVELTDPAKCSQTGCHESE
jgi:hypothetical protein